VLQCDAVFCSVLQCVAATEWLLYCSHVVQCAAVCFSVLQHIAVCCSHRIASDVSLRSGSVQCVAVCCSQKMQCVAVCCSQKMASNFMPQVEILKSLLAPKSTVSIHLSVFFRVVQRTTVLLSPSSDCVAVYCSVLQCVAVCCNTFSGGQKNYSVAVA